MPIRPSVGLLRRRLPLLGPILLISAGCHSPHATSSSRLASILINDRPLPQIEAVTQAVFREKGYQVSRRQPGQFVFEKAGTSMNTFVYGDWSDQKVWVRVKLYLTKLGNTQQVLLDCDAYMVNEHGDPRFEEEHKLTRMRRGRYQELLETIGQRLR